MQFAPATRPASFVLTTIIAELIAIGFGDAWEGVSQSCDAGDTWRSRLAPGYPGDTNAVPIPAEFAADPRLAAIPGMAIFNFIAGYRDSNVGVLAIQHWLEVNKEDADHYEPGRQTYIADEGTSGRFLDKPDMIAVMDPPGKHHHSGHRDGKHGTWRQRRDHA